MVGRRPSPLSVALPRCGLVIAVCVSCLTLGWAQSRDADYAATLKKGDAALAAGQYRDAVEAYKKANALHDKTSVQAYFGMSRGYFGLRAFQEAIDACTESLKFTGGDKRLEGQMRYMRGLSQVALGAQENTDSRLKLAEADFRATLELTDTIALASYNLGTVLLKEKRDAEGVKELQTYVSRTPNAPQAEEARRMIADPSRARATVAPDFAVPTLEGKRISLSDYRGQVVLLDFWGTWCGPCREFTPTLVEVNRRLAGQAFVMIGVAVAEKSETAWKDYIAEHKMTWPQYLDTSKKIARLFDVHEFPTYILIDQEGVLRDRRIGFSPDNASWLNDSLKKYVKATLPKLEATLGLAR